jgi:hypothetical protein
MRRVVWLALLFGFLVAAAWASAAVEYQGRTPIGHLIVWSKASHPWETAMRWIEKRYDSLFAPEPPAAKSKGRSKTATPIRAPQPKQEPLDTVATAKRVALLESAAAEVEAPAQNAKPARVRLDERLSSSDKKALDQILSTRVTRDR